MFGESHASAEHAYQLTKAIRSGDITSAEKIRDSKTALDAKKIGKTVRGNFKVTVANWGLTLFAAPRTIGLT